MQNRKTETERCQESRQKLGQEPVSSFKCNYADNYYGDQVCVQRKL